MYVFAMFHGLHPSGMFVEMYRKVSKLLQKVSEKLKKGFVWFQDVSKRFRKCSERLCVNFGKATGFCIRSQEYYGDVSISYWKTVPMD
jgi:hypothetical protein